MFIKLFYSFIYTIGNLRHFGEKTNPNTQNLVPCDDMFKQ